MKTITDYPVQVVTPTEDHIMWIFTGEWCLIDNYAPCLVKIDLGIGEMIYPTSEHAYAAAKAQNHYTHLAIAEQPDPGAAKGAGRQCLLRKDWESIKFDVMWRVLVAKFQQNADALAVLYRTEDRPIYEGNYWNDAIWGVLEQKDGTWKGRNALGQMLMEIRDFGIPVL
ncbi:MAG: NADAR family protein [Pigmentiphaga sp.]|nr:NADAR family protein [Pigmentiphaga sp.]